MIGASQSIFLDATVLHQKTQRDWVVLLTVDRKITQPPYKVLWSWDVLAEAIATLRDRKPTIQERALGEWADALVTHPTLREGKVVGYDPKSWPCPPGDEHDHHVVAAAAHGGASYLLTSDKRLLEWDVPAEMPFEVWTPDELLQLLDERDPALLDRRLVDEVEYRKKHEEADWEQGKLGAIKALVEADMGGLAHRLCQRHGVALPAAEVDLGTAGPADEAAKS